MDPDGAAGRRWDLVLPHRDYLVRIARRRGMSRADAEDCAQEAMLRCVGFANLDEDRVQQFLVATTVRLCADHYRRHARDARIGRRLGAWYGDEPSPEEATCGRGEAVWVAGHVASLPASQRAALAGRADGLTCTEIAARMGLSYKAVESLLARARASVRAAVASAYVLVFRLARRGVRVPGGAGAMSVVALVSVSVFLSHATAPPGRGAARKAIAGPAARVGVAGRSTGDAPTAAAPTALLTPPLPVAVPAMPGSTGTPSTPVVPPVPVVPTDPCDLRLPFAETCVPVGDVSPSGAWHDCVDNGIDLSRGFECRPSPSPEPRQKES